MGGALQPFPQTSSWRCAYVSTRTIFIIHGFAYMIHLCNWCKVILKLYPVFIWQNRHNVDEWMDGKSEDNFLQKENQEREHNKHK
jgi:hypothetical protein